MQSAWESYFFIVFVKDQWSNRINYNKINDIFWNLCFELVPKNVNISLLKKKKKNQIYAFYFLTFYEPCIHWTKTNMEQAIIPIFAK